MSNKTTVVLTTSAQAYFARHLNDDQWIRLSVKPSGCSGYEYDLTISTELEQDVVYEQHGLVKVGIPKPSLTMLLGTEVDYTLMTAGQSKITYRNPQAQDYCGCGVSFSLKEESHEA